MQIVYAFCYYFLIIFLGLTFGLIVFAFRPIRRLLHRIQTKYQAVLNNIYWQYTINFSFAIIFLILLDSVRSFVTLGQMMKNRNFLLIQMNLRS
jgi:hypothetical protein